MKTKKLETKYSRVLGFMHRKVASFMAVIFIFSGILVATSFAAVANTTNLELDTNNRAVPVVSYDPAEAQATAPSSNVSIPSGVAIQGTNPLSAPTPASTQTSNVVQVASSSTKASLSTLQGASTGDATTSGRAATSLDTTQKVQTLQPVVAKEDPQVPFPADWSLAKSNPNFSFGVLTEIILPIPQTIRYTLYLWDIKKNSVQTIAVKWNVEPGGFTDVHDVSPDGTTLIYGGINLANPSDPQSQFARIQRVNDSSKVAETHQGELVSISFSSSGVATLGLQTIYPSGTIIESRASVNLGNFQITASDWRKLIKEGNDVFYPGENLLVQIERVPWGGNGFKSRILVYDTTRGMGNMRLVSEINFGSGYPATAQIKNISTAIAGGKRFVSVSMEALSGNGDGRVQYSYVINAESGEMLTLSGWTESVVYSAGRATYKLRLQDPTQYGETKNIRYVTVDLLTLKIILSVPQGWTLATSNVNFAFTEVYERVGQYSRYTLKLQDLRTGQIQDIATRMSPYGGFTDVYDVSPDGTTVIYGKSGSASPKPVPYTICLQRIIDPSQKLVLNGELKSVSYSGLVATLVMANGSKQWVNLKTLKVIPLPPVPPGWTVVPSVPNMAYQIIAGNRVRMMDLMTKFVSDKPSSQNQGDGQTGLYYVITSTGVKEIYSVKIPWNRALKSYDVAFVWGGVLKSYDPVTKRWANYTA